MDDGWIDDLRFLWRRHSQSYIPQQSLIGNFWRGAPANIDAAFESRASDRVFLFKGANLSLSLRPSAFQKHESMNFLSSLVTDRQVWAFRGYDPLTDYPKSISTFGLPKTVQKVDAALYDEQSGKILFFAGSEHYRCAVIQLAP